MFDSFIKIVTFILFYSTGGEGTVVFGIISVFITINGL